MMNGRKGKKLKGKETFRRLRHLPVIFALFFLFPSPVDLTSSAASGDLNPVSTATREGRIIVFDDLWETVQARYYDPAFHGIDWQAERDKFRPLAADAPGAAEFYAVLRRMLGQLRDAHTRVYAPDERSDWQRPRFISVGLSVREVNGQAVVTTVERGSDAERAGLRAGDSITRVDDEPALAVFARRLIEQQGASTVAAARLRAMATIFDGARETTVRVGWVDAGGKERFTSLRREWRKRESVLRVRRVSGYGVVEFEAFTQTITVDLMRALADRLRGLRGLVLDLRNNGGGEAEAMTEIASAFLPAGKNLGRFTDRAGRVAFEPQTRAALMLAADSITPFRAPVVILTSERTSSAAEIFVAAIKDARRATILGTSTCGCVLAIRRRHTLPDGGELDVSEMDYRTASGARLEGAGVAPDEKIPLDIKDLRAGRDRALEQAIQFLKSKDS
ncbi:MAG: S41 family peptidase [Pyrinomonadaceae bacterium]